jgi:hypothetical protein
MQLETTHHRLDQKLPADSTNPIQASFHEAPPYSYAKFFASPIMRHDSDHLRLAISGFVDLLRQFLPDKSLSKSAV